MDDQRRDALGALLEQALDLPPEARRPFIDQAAADDPALSTELEELIAAAALSSGYFERLESVAARALSAAVGWYGDHLR